MKSAIFITLFFAFAHIPDFAQQDKSAIKGATYGEVIQAEGAYPVTRLVQKIGSNTTLENTKISGKVVDVCTKKGCFMKLDKGNGETVMVRFKDYGFFVPADIKGKNVVVEGKAIQETLSVEKLKHYAADAGKSTEDIAQIKNPQQQLNFEAKGVLVQ